MPTLDCPTRSNFRRAEIPVAHYHAARPATPDPEVPKVKGPQGWMTAAPAVFGAKWTADGPASDKMRPFIRLPKSRHHEPVAGAFAAKCGRYDPDPNVSGWVKVAGLAEKVLGDVRLEPCPAACR